jgi:hypothetical protein
MAGAMGRRTGFRGTFFRALLVSALAAPLGITCGGGPCGSRVVVMTADLSNGLDCSVCGEPVIFCDQVTIESGTRKGFAVACNIANICPGN